MNKFTSQSFRESKPYLIAALIKNYLIDMKKFAKFSGVFNSVKTQEHHEASLIFYYHKIEKGLSLPNPKPGFGKKHVYFLVDLLVNYTNKYGWDEVSIVTLNTLFAYHDFNVRSGQTMDDLLNKITNLKNKAPKENNLTTGGVTELFRTDIHKKFTNFKEFAYSRYSIRNFTPDEVSLDLIKEAVEIAQKTPSVCNRQSSRVYVYSDEQLKKEVLKCQYGNAGFGETANKILIVTSKRENFVAVNERNQGYIDGGMYAMSLIYALHSLGLGTCPLNLSLVDSSEKRLKRTAKISDSEILIMMIAVGKVPEKLRVASSHRRNASEVMEIY
ncbi:nitroreductase family protein [Ureibacillus sp. MALMAid1270]|uniref:nitroreductase family protein n=1 Tax=Ureibacillus sp. MALMAid1270 TaxID=3411629 RepID=UPI003BA47E9C